MSLESTDILELMDRYNYLVQEYVKLAGELVGPLEKFGKYKQELQAIIVEFVKRKVTPDDPEHLKKLVEEELIKRGIKI
jgi:hypothetical protein